MRIRNYPYSALVAALESVNGEYKGNLRLVDAESKGNGVQFRLGVKDSRAYGARLASSGKRHTPSTSWEAHRDLFRAVYRTHPDAVIVTMVATYRGSADFEEKFPATQNFPMGSRAEPTTIRELSIYP